MYQVIIWVVFFFAMVSCSMATSALKGQGVYPSPGKICNAELRISSQGGFLQLFIQDGKEKPVHVADDVTGLMWVKGKSLVFSASPIYGKPGVFRVVCDAGHPRLTTLVASKNINSSYPDGADYFELRGIKGDDIEFYYGHDVDSVDFTEFHSERYLNSVELPKDNK